MNKYLFRSLLTLVLLSCWSSLPAQGQNAASVEKSASNASAVISVSTSNGKTTITYQGKKVWSGKTTGKVTGKAKSVDGVDYAAAFDGDKVIWENVAGASRHLK